jgi:ABC-type bacteriocin/lantibiotic exporter with double-glycine peptidase domain
VFYYSWQIGAFLIITSFLQALVPVLYGKKLEKAGAVYVHSNEKHLTTLKDYLSSFVTAKIFHIEDRLSDNYRKVVTYDETNWNRREFLQTYINSLSYVFNKIAYLGVFLIGSYLMLKGDVRLSIIVAITDIVPYISDPAEYLVDDLAQLKSAKESFFRVEEITSQKVQAEKTDAPLHLQTIRLSDVSFGYGDQNVLNHITYQFRLPQKYLIVGRSGGGKSTLLNLISGLEDEYAGKIMLNEYDIRDVTRNNIARNICLIEQTPFLQ